jgi:heme/copper-type cytochrome/quinol oxidase subunit 1
MRGAMMPAKLFAAATLALVATLIVARLWTRAPLNAPTIDIYVHDTYFVVAGRHFLLLGILICMASAIVYYACARWLNLSLNGTLVLLHFACVIFAMLALLWEVLAAKRAIEAMSHATTNIVVPLLSLFLGCVLFGVNIIWALIVRLRQA